MSLTLIPCTLNPFRCCFLTTRPRLAPCIRRPSHRALQQRQYVNPPRILTTRPLTTSRLLDRGTPRIMCSTAYSTAADTDMQQPSPPEGALHRAVISFGSNLTKNSRVDNIEAALKHIKDSGLRISKTSHLYETKPMYYDDQEAFLNGVCEVETTLSPLDLLDLLQRIESQLGRIRSIRNGPRTIDLDVLLYDNLHINLDRLNVPHPLMLERDFVLRPLCE